MEILLLRVREHNFLKTRFYLAIKQRGPKVVYSVTFKNSCAGVRLEPCVHSSSSSEHRTRSSGLLPTGQGRVQAAHCHPGRSAHTQGERGRHPGVSHSLPPHELYSPWNSPDQNTGMGSCSLLQGIFRTQVSRIAAGSLPAKPPSCEMPGWVAHSSVHFSRSVVSGSFPPHGLQHPRLPCPSPTLRVYPNSCPLSR